MAKGKKESAADRKSGKATRSGARKSAGAGKRSKAKGASGRARRGAAKPEDEAVVETELHGEADNGNGADPHDDDFDIGVEFEVDPKFPFGRDGPFGEHGLFGDKGVFGPDGPFGPGGPFGPAGVFGPGGVFARSGRHKGRSHRARHRHGGRTRRERMFGPGELRLVLLAMLAEEPRHGYELIKALEEMTEGAYAPSPGTIYPTLQLLSDEGAIAEQDSEDARKLYQATEAGLAELKDRKSEIEHLWRRLGRKTKRARPTGPPDLFRSLGNLATVLTNHATKGGLSGERKEEVIDLIDELARKIERL